MVARNIYIGKHLVRFAVLILGIGLVEYLILYVLDWPLTVELTIQIIISVILMTSIIHIWYRVWEYVEYRYPSGVVDD
ncbi:MAG: hypothetical protein R3224_11140 [Balneolaceae bacterium]|nr:hypothetical protein [Balneolaceae bacterium]